MGIVYWNVFAFKCYCSYPPCLLALWPTKEQGMTGSSCGEKKKELQGEGKQQNEKGKKK